jgi:hypothetical protein
MSTVLYLRTVTSFFFSRGMCAARMGSASRISCVSPQCAQLAHGCGQHTTCDTKLQRRITNVRKRQPQLPLRARLEALVARTHLHGLEAEPRLLGACVGAQSWGHAALKLSSGLLDCRLT